MGRWSNLSKFSIPDPEDDKKGVSKKDFEKLKDDVSDLKEKLDERVAARNIGYGQVRADDLEPALRQNLHKKVSAGVGLTMNSAEDTISMGTPGSLSSTAGNSASGTTHTHWLDPTVVQAYYSGRSYAAGDYCTYSGNIYRCISASTGNTPTFPSSSYWVWEWGKVTLSTSAASGTPADGDIWLQRES